MKIITVTDYYGKSHDVPVSDEFFEDWKKLQNETQRVEHKEFYHREWIPIDVVDYFIKHPFGSELENDLILSEREQALWEAIAKLTPTQRVRVQMLLDNWSMRDIANHDHCHYNSVKESLVSALKKIRKYMDD